MQSSKDAIIVATQGVWGGRQAGGNPPGFPAGLRTNPYVKNSNFYVGFE